MKHAAELAEVLGADLGAKKAANEGLKGVDNRSSSPRRRPARQLPAVKAGQTVPWAMAAGPLMNQ